MGGKGAKERRRLQRLAKRGLEDDTGKSASQTLANNAKKHDSVEKEAEKSTKHAKAFKELKPPHGKFRDGKHDSRRFTKQAVHFHKQHHERRATPKKAEIKKKKVKKPKHLKRKIESLEQDSKERERLVGELNEWQEKKKARSSKRQEAGAVRKRVQNETINPPLASDHEELIADVPASNENDSSATSNDTKTGNTNGEHGETVPSDHNKKDASHVPRTDDSVRARSVSNTSFIKTNNDSESDSDSDVSVEEATKRQRGRRRRGRKSTSEKPNPEQNELQSDTAKETQPLSTEKYEFKDDDAEQETPTNEETVLRQESPKKTSRKDDKRRCIGRKPVTDFVVGERYSGTVVYIKPFGAFIDVGCHSDAFCHVSRIQDDYVESIHDVLKEGDKVSARVVEVDRQSKRITVSLQSDARLEDENASREAKRQRTEKRAAKSKSNHTDVSNTTAADESAWTQPPQERTEPPCLDESEMTPAELKRARKLARRAARREQQAKTGVAA